MYKNNSYNYREELNWSINVNRKFKNSGGKNGLFLFGNGSNAIDWKAQCCMVLYGQNVCHLLAFLAPQVMTESTSLTAIKKDFCLLISYISFLCISISLVVPSGNSCVRLGVEHCIFKLQVVEEFGLSPCRQHEVIFTWFIRYSFLHFASCIEFISQTSSVSPVRAEQ